MSQAELQASRGLRAILAPLATSAPIEHSAEFLEFQCALEYYLPAELGWKHESFDGFRFAIARKVGPREAEFVGLALLISDQAWTPFYLRLLLAPDFDEIATIDCRVGEPGDGSFGLIRIPYSSKQVDQFLFSLPDRIAAISWVFRAARA